jgi:phosphohistidine phosphatase
MKYLLLIRHAKSSWSNPTLEDVARPLNARGKKEAILLGNFLKELELIPDQILTSHAKRARKTTKKINKSLLLQKDKILINEIIYTDDHRDIIKLLCSVGDEINLLSIVGHSPSLLVLGNYLIRTKIENISTCGIILIRFEEDTWKDISANKGKLILSL